MKKIFRALTLCLVLLSLLCAAVPAAFSAGNKEDAFYTIGLDACGGVSSTVISSLLSFSFASASP